MFFFVFLEAEPFQVPKVQALWSTALYLYIYSSRPLSIPAPLPWVTTSHSFTSFIWSGSTLAPPRVLLLTFFNTGHPQSMCTDVSFSALHFWHDDDDFTYPIGTAHDCRSANVVGIKNVNTVLLNGKIMIFKSF